MRIVFFGSSHGFPEPGRRCSSILIEIGETRYFIDMGTQSIEQLADRGIRPETVKACFVTHMHGDHTNGFISFIDLCSWYYTKAFPEFYFPGDTDRCVEAIREWLSCLAITVINNNPVIDYDKCTNCGKCKEDCPRKCII